MNFKLDKKINYKRLGLVLFVLIVLMFVVWQIGVGRTETETAEKITANNSFNANGWFFRNETVVEGISGDTVKHIVQGGDKVQKDAPLAVIYSNRQALENGQKIEVIDEQIELLKSTSETITSTNDLVKVESMITSKISEITAQVQEGVVSRTQSGVSELRNLCLRKGISNVGTEALKEQTQKLEAESNYLKQQEGNLSTVISSPASGFFSEIVDGFENILTMDKLKEITLDDIENLDPNQIKTTKGGSLGKIVRDFRWYFAMSVKKSDIEDLSTGDKIYLRFSQMNKDIPVTVENIQKQKNKEKALLIVSGMEITPEILSLRYQSVDVIKQTYKGIKVPKSAVRVVEDSDGKPVRGVYILTGSISRFKPIDVLYEMDNYYVVKQGTDSADTGVVAGDSIIVKGKDLEDLKVIK